MWYSTPPHAGNPTYEMPNPPEPDGKDCPYCRDNEATFLIETIKGDPKIEKWYCLGCDREFIVEIDMDIPF